MSKDPSALVRQLAQDDPLRDLVIRCASTFLNLVLAVFNVVVAQSQHSLWGYAMAGYFGVLTVMGSFVAVCMRHAERYPVRRILRFCAICFGALAIALGVLMAVCVSQQRREEIPQIMMIAMATLTFCTTGMAIADATRLHNGTPLEQIIARVSIASAVGAMLVLEIQMLGTFGDPSGKLAFVLETASGAVAVIIVLLMSGSLLKRAASYPADQR